MIRYSHNKIYKKNIIIFVSSISRKSGGLSSALDLAEALYNLGYNLHIGLTGSSRLTYLLKDKKESATRIPFSRIHTMHPKMLKYLSRKFENGKNSRSVLKKTKNLINRALGKLEESKNNKILNSSHIIIITGEFYSGGYEYLKKTTNAKLIFNHPGSVEKFKKYYLNNNHNPNKSLPNMSSYANFMNQFDCILFQAKDQAKECEMQHEKLKNKTIVLRPTCKENDVLASLNSISPYNSNKFIIVNIGSIIPRKAQNYSIQAFKKIVKLKPEFELHFVGNIQDKEYYIKLDKIIKKEKLDDKVFFHGHKKDYLRYMAHADILLQTSKSEGVSRILREAMFLNIPIISFAIPGTKEILTNDINAILIEPFDIDKMSDKILYASNNYSEVMNLSDKALEKYYKCYSNASYLRSLIRIINVI